MWLVVFPTFAVGIVIAGIAINQRRFHRRTATENRALLAQRPSLARSAAARTLPDVVERYRRLAVGESRPVHTLRLRHRGTFRTSETSKPKPIRGMQLFTVDPPGFVWAGRVRVFPGIWIDARDMFVNGAGSMRVLLDDTLVLADEQGPRLDGGSALRLLAEMVWFPTALFDPRIVTWDVIDDTHARATLRWGTGPDRAVSGVFTFGPDGLPRSMTAHRYKAVDDGQQPWGGTYRDWRNVGGMLVPFEAEVAWQSDPPFVYAHWHVDEMNFELEGDVDLVKPPKISIGPLAKVAMGLEVLLGVGAIVGGLALMAGPHGEILPLPPAMLAGSPFASFFVPGLILFVILGLGPLISALFTLRGHHSAPFLAFASGGALLVWIVVEIALVGYSSSPPLQLLYLLLGVVITGVGFAWLEAVRTSRGHRAAAA